MNIVIEKALAQARIHERSCYQLAQWANHFPFRSHEWFVYTIASEHEAAKAAHWYEVAAASRHQVDAA